MKLKLICKLISFIVGTVKPYLNHSHQSTSQQHISQQHHGIAIGNHCVPQQMRHLHQMGDLNLIGGNSNMNQVCDQASFRPMVRTSNRKRSNGSLITEYQCHSQNRRHTAIVHDCSSASDELHEHADFRFNFAAGTCIEAISHNLPCIFGLNFLHLSH